MILPHGHPDWPDTAYARLSRVLGFAPRGISENTDLVGSIGDALSDPACLYRYPSPRGRSYHPNGRPPAFSWAGKVHANVWIAGKIFWQIADCRRVSAAIRSGSAPLRAGFHVGLREPAVSRNVAPGSQNNVRGTDICFTGSSFSPRRSWAASRPADNHSASRPSSAPAVARQRRRSSAAALGRVPSWAPRQTWPIATNSRAAATDAVRAAVAPRNTDMTPTTVASRRGGLFFGIEPAARAIAGGERDRRCSTRS